MTPTFLEPDQLLEGEIAACLLPDGRRMAIVPLTFGRARLVICNARQPMFLDDLW